MRLVVKKAGLTVGLAAVAAALALTACTSGSSGAASNRSPVGDATSGSGVAQSGGAQAGSGGSASGSGAPATPSTSTTPPAPPAVVKLTPSNKAAGVDPAAPITVNAAGGTLTAVHLQNTASKVVVPGKLSADHKTWTAAEDLGYGNQYAIRASAVNADGKRTTTTSTFRTLTPSNQTQPYLVDIYGSALQNNGTYGIGMIPVVHFDEPITNEKAAEKALHVTTTPHVDGSWYWLDDQDVHWRPRNFYKPGTKVTIAADVYGVDVGNGLYGQSDQSVSFTIGASHISIADENTHSVKVYFDGKLKRTMLTSFGKHGGEYVNGNWINFWTPNGTYTVLGYENPAKMCSASYGLPVNAPGGYPCELVPWSTKITTDGIYLHELDSTVQYQGNTDVSHGCLNLNHDNAEWYFTHSRVGDVVKVINMKGAPTVSLSVGGDWSVPWSQWLKGSALAS